ncbi:MAG TPA: SRPBCC family protein [Bacteroidales bacterium]|nr:SRPBCC family protein [Bacteroidales bacterium]HSA44123.1 SRPBCC family protein [Bacteroidales bacterium]
MPYLKQQQYLPVSPEHAWKFFSNPSNLNAVTPPGLDFRITSEVPDSMYEGLMITYSLKPMLKVSLTWWTEITHIVEGKYFIDEQRKGPYRIWHHEHHFEPKGQGVLMTDILYYDIGKSFFGWLAGRIFVHRRVRQIFAYRRQALEKYFSVPR